MSESICVIRDKNFSDAARRLNLSEDALERIVHKYVNEIGDADAFPSDSYIKAQYAVSNIVSNSNINDLEAIWEESFSTPIRVETLAEACILKDEASQYFKDNAIVIKPLNDGTFQVVVAKPRTATVVTTQPRGTIVYNKEQLAAIDAAVKHIDRVRAGIEKQKFFTIQGKAGTGKTTIVNEILNRMKKGSYSRPIVIMGALSHKATTVLKGKINADTARNFDMQNKTIAGMLGMRPTNEGTFEPIPGIVPPIQRASVVFIDEASMVNEEQLELILNAIKNKSIPVVFLGDKGQLPPVRSGRYYDRRKIASDKLSPIFEDKSIPSVSLVTRVRQGEDSPVLDYADDYWNFSQGKREEYPNDLKTKSKVTDRGALIVQREEVDLVQQLLPLFQEAKRTGNPNLVKIVPYTTNSRDSKESAVDKYNRLIRKALYPNATSEGFEKGDLIIFNDTYGNENSSIPNSFESAVESVRPCESSLPQFDGLELEEVEREYITFNTPWGHAVVPALVPTRANRLKHQRNLTKIAKYCKSNKHAWPRFWDYKNLYAANIGYAYAIDSHKSQGSTYEVVAVDAADINSVQPTTLKTKAQSIYTALTRASNVTIVSSNTTNESTVYTDIKAINDRINAVKAGQEVDEKFTPETEEDVFAEVTEDDLDNLIKDPNRKAKRVKKKGNVDDEEYNPVIEKANIPDYDEDEGEGWDSDNEDKDEEEDEEIEDRPQSKPTPKKNETPQERTYREFTAAQKQLNSVIKFKKATHSYIVNGIKADFSVTEFKDFVFGNTRDNNDFLEISSRLGNTHDAFLRDYFANELKDSYPNLTSKQIEKLKIQAAKLESLLTETYGEDAIFITDEDLLRTAARVTYDGKEYTVAGTMDMVVIDNKGNIHIVDFKTKRANISEELDEDKISEYGLQVSLYKAFVASNSLFKNKVGRTQIAQFNLKYADPRKYDYSFKGEQIYIELDGEDFKLQEAQKDGKVPYTSGLFNNKLLGLSINLSEEDIEVSPIKTGLQKISDQREEDKKTSVEPKKGTGQMVEFYGEQKRSDIKAASTFGAILEGKRTATTRVKHWDYWKQFKVGDVITFKDINGRTVDVRITVAPHKLSKDLDLDEWSEKEGWTKDRFTKTKDKNGKTLMDYTRRGEAFQMEYELLEKKEPTSIEVNSHSKKYELLSNFGRKSFEIDGRKFSTVEHYFHWAKAIHCKDYAMANRILKAVSPKQARHFGKYDLEMTEAQQASWDKMSRNVMKKGMRAAFEQSEDAKDLLLSTGTAELTHFYNKRTGKSEGPFADILMELREEFGGAGKPTTTKEAEKKAKEEVKKSKEVPEAPTKKSESKLKTRYGVVSTIQENENSDYEGYGLSIDSIQEKKVDSSLHVEKISDRYTPKTSSDVEQFNTAAEALRKQGWHVEFYSKKSKDGSITNDVMTISIEGNPKKGFFELVKDQEEGNYSIHFKTKSKKAMNGSEFAEEALEDSEKEDMFKALIYAIPEGGTVSTWGTLSKGGISALDSLARRSGGALQKVGDKLAKDSEDNDTRIPVYKKLTEDELAAANIAKVKKANVVRKSSNDAKVQDDYYSIDESTEKDSRFTSICVLNLHESQTDYTDAEGKVRATAITDITNGSKNNVLRNMVKAMPYSSVLSLNTDIVNANFLYTLDELLHNPMLHIMPTDEVITIDPNSAEGMIAKEYAKAGKRLQYDSKTGELHVPKFTVGYTIAEIEKRAAYDKMINNDLLTQEELRSLSKAAMYKLSEFITMIQTYKNGYEILFGKESNEDFTKMSRIDIINKVGLKNLLLKVRERVFDSENADASVALETLDKMDIVFNNWEAFVELGYDTLIGLEEIALDGKENIKNDLNNTVEEDDESIIQEMFGSSLEHWQVGFRQVSAFSSLSKLIKRTMDSLYELDQDGNQIIDEYGIAKHLDAQAAVSKILYFTQGAQSLDDKDANGDLRSNSMLYMLKQNANAEPWLEQVIELIEGKFDEQGNLVKAADEQFKAQFYSNFKKYFQKYCITFKDKNGKVLIKTINESQYSDTLLKESQAKENSFATGGFKLKLKDGSINQENLEKLKDLVSDIARFAEKAEAKGKIADLINLDNYHKTLKNLFDLLDIDTPADESLFNLFGVKKNLKELNKHLSYLVDAIKDNVTVTNNRDYQQIVKLIAKEMGLEMESVSYEAGKMYYSYVLPSYLGRLITKLKSENMSDTEYQEFLQNEYLKYRWFRTEKGKVRCHWLDRLRRSKEARDNFEHVTSLHYLGTDYSSKTPMEYIASMMRMYFYDNNKKWAYFRVPMLSNKPSEEYIKFERISTAYQDTIINYMQDIFTQELDRIQAVRERQGNIREDQKIVSKGKKGAFDKRGLEFVFEDYLQKYLDGTYNQRLEYENLTDEQKAEEAEFSRILNAKLDGTIEEDSKDYAKLITLFKKMTRRGFEENYQLARQQWVDEGFLTLNEDGTIKKVAGDMKLSEEDLKEFFWNDAFAATQILELTITDMAYYVDTEDLQKRLAQLHAPGMQSHIQAKDRNGNLYTKDGIERTMYIKDDMIKSSILKNLEMAKEQIIDDTPADRRAAVRKQLAGIIDAFKSVNFADAQGYSCPSSYRKKMGIFGNWDDRMEDAYEKVTHPEKYPDVNLSDMLDVLWQPLKPFVYSQIAKPGYNSILPELKVSVQNKNSEYVLVIADALLQRAGIPNKLRAIYEFMEESQHNSDGSLNGEGIDTIQFMSAVNAGCSGVIDLNDVVNSNGSITYITEDEVKERLNRAYEINDNGDITYSKDYVHEIPFEDYIIQQNVPAHFMEHKQVHGSQDRILTFADILDEDPATGETNYLTIDGEQVSVAEAKKNYFQAIADNIEESKQELIRRFKLNLSNPDDPNYDPKAVNVAISKVLKDTILKDSRYGSDLLWACDTNEYGEFNIPLSDPTQSTRIQQLLNSIIKNTINKQEIAGGPIVQVSNWGVSTQLAIRFKNGSGELLLTEKEFNELKSENPNKQIIPRDYDYISKDGKRKWQSVEGYDSYESYIGDQAGVAYYEALVPIPDENFAKDFMRKDANGNEYIDIEEMERTNPDLLYMIGYRIPTESKYSMVPIKVKGFLPRIGGEGIMLPADITSQAGSDFDIDKEYVMKFVFNRIEKDGKVTYGKPKSGRGYRDNLIVATQLAVLQSEQVQKQLFTPGNFDEPKKYGYLISYVQNEAARTGRDPEEIWEEAKDWDNDTLKDKNKTSKNLIFNNVQVQFHKQNMTAGKLIGIFAQANVSHAFISLEKDTVIHVPEDTSFTINGIHVGENFIIDDILSRDRSVNISNNLAALLAASVDAVKDPILNLINININTANMVTSMLRMGFSLETVSLLASQPIIRNLIRDYAIQRAEKYVDINVLIEKALESIPDDIKQVDDISVTNDDLIANLNGNSAITNYMVLQIFQRMQAISDTFGDITHMTRYNSVTAAVGPFASDTMLQKTKDDAFNNNKMIGDAIRRACDNPILYAFRESAYYIESKLLGEHLIQAGVKFESALDQLGKTLGFRRGVPSKVANAFSDFYMSFYVNDSEEGSVFDLGYENRKYMITQFPKDFLRLKKKYKDNLLINSVQYVENDREQYPFLQLKTRGLNSTVLEDIKNAWITLYNNSDSRDLALRLVEYNFFRGSFGFSPKTFMNLVPNVVKSNLNSYINVLNKRDSRVQTLDRTDRIIHQFILHNPDLIIDRYYKLENYSPVPIVDDVYGDCIEVSRKSSKESKKKDYTLKASRPFIKIDSKTYLVARSDEDSMILKEVDELGGDGQGFEISVDEEFPKSVFDSSFKATKKESNDRGGESFKKDDMSAEELGVIIDQLFNGDEIQELNDLKTQKAIDKINRRLEDSDYDIKVSKSGRMEKRLMKLLDKVEGVSNPTEILNKAGKTIDDLNLCS